MKAFGEGQVASQALLGPVSPITSQGADFIYSYLQLFEPVPVLFEIFSQTCLLGPCQMSAHYLPHAVRALMRCPRGISPGI